MTKQDRRMIERWLYWYWKPPFAPKWLYAAC